MKLLSLTLSALLIGIFIAVPFSDFASTFINKEFVGPLIVAVPSIKAVP